MRHLCLLQLESPNKFDTRQLRRNGTKDEHKFQAAIDCRYSRLRQSSEYDVQWRSCLCLSVRLSAFPRNISKNDAARITKLDVDMVHKEYWKSIYFRNKWSKVKITRHKKQVCFGLQTKRNIDACCVRQLRWVFPWPMLLLSAGFPCVGF